MAYAVEKMATIDGRCDFSTSTNNNRSAISRLDVLNQRAMSDLEKASRAIDWMLNPFTDSSSSYRSEGIQRELERAFDIFQFTASERIKGAETSVSTLAQVYYNLACVHSLSAELVMVENQKTQESNLSDNLGIQEIIDVKLEEAEELLLMAEEEGYNGRERMLKDRKLRVLRATSNIHNSMLPSDDTMVSSYKLV